MASLLHRGEGWKGTGTTSVAIHTSHAAKCRIQWRIHTDMHVAHNQRGAVNNMYPMSKQHTARKNAGATITPQHSATPSYAGRLSA